MHDVDDATVRAMQVPVGRLTRLALSLVRTDPRRMVWGKCWFDLQIRGEPGDRPPCMHRIFSSTIAATGKQLKQSVNVFHSLREGHSNHAELWVQFRGRHLHIPGHASAWGC